MNRFFSLLFVLLFPGIILRAQQEAAVPEPPAVAGTTAADPDPQATSEPEGETPPSGDAASFVVPEEMGVFSSHVGNWKGLTKTEITEKGKKSMTNTRSEWSGGYLLGGNAFEIRGFSYGELGRTQYRWQYSYDSLKERYMAAYYDSHGRTHFCEGKINQENTKIIWRLLVPPGDMAWHVETDLEAGNGIETNGRITSEQFDYNMVYTSVFKRP
ncbi:MAG: hypothetical protein ACI8T1_004254 [Verrucomicrobiales bacterium]|jgi:hypothetical protein